MVLANRDVIQVCGLNKFYKILIYLWSSTLPKTSSRGRGQPPEMIEVCDYDILIVLVELNTLI